MAPIPMIEQLPRLTVTACFDILAVAFLIYQFLMIIRGRRAAHILTGIWILGVVYLISVWAQLELLRTILAALAPYTAFALIVMFQSELRRLLARIGRRRWHWFGTRLERREVVDELLMAVSQFAARKTGAIVIIERDIGLRSFIESGVRLDGVLSRELLCSIFEPGAALHDGAVIVQGDRIAAAACFLPLTMNPALQTTLGTRHRAAIGVTEEADCLAVVVSEETGQISIAFHGEIETNVTIDRLEARLTSHAARKESAPQAPVSIAQPETRWHAKGS